MVTVTRTIEGAIRKPTIYGKPLDWHAVKKESSNRGLARYNRTASIFAHTSGDVRCEIEAKATEIKVSLFPPSDPYIMFEAEVITTSEGYKMMKYNAQLKYPPEITKRLSSPRYPGFPRFSELTPEVLAYFQSLGHDIVGIRSEWENDPNNENYQRYMRAKGNQPHSPYLAQTVTASGKNAQRLGFAGHIDIQEKDRGGQRGIHYLQVDFFHPRFKPE